MPERRETRPSTFFRVIRKAREKQKISLDTLANDTGFDKNYLKKIETGKLTPPVGILLQLSRALGIDSSSLLRNREEDKEKRVNEYIKRTLNYAYETLTPGAENKHLKAFRVAIDPRKDHEGVGYIHEGEEFIYVVTGEIEVTVGDHVNRIKRNGSLHFNSGVRHRLRNISDENAELLVVIYSP